MKHTIESVFWLKIIMIPIAMFGFAFLLIPLYDVFCEVTGFNGRTTQQSVAHANVIDDSRRVTVDFTASTATGFDAHFYPKARKMDVIPGKRYRTYYIAENRSQATLIGQAVPSVAPTEAARHFKKVECFCFTRQTFEPKQRVEMPVNFVVDAKLAKNVHNITLSYNFFKIEEPTKH